jgi:membrane protease YdiL (CAAX protease family)
MELEDELLDQSKELHSEPDEITKARWTQVAVALCLCFVPAWLSNLYNTSNYYPSTPFDNSFASVIANFPSAIALLYIAYNGKWTPAHFGLDRLKWQHFGFGVATCFFALIADFFARTLQFIILSKFLPQTDGNDLLNPGLVPVLPVLVISLILNSLVEEISFRGFIDTHLPILLKSPVFGIIISAALFSSYHIYQGWDSLFPIFIFGISMAISRKIFESIWPAIIGHTLCNLMIYMGCLNFLPQL